LADNPATNAPIAEARWLNAVVETAVDGVILIDARGTVLMFNSACEKLFQYRASEVIGQNLKMLMPGQHREEHDGYIDNFNRTGCMIGHGVYSCLERLPAIETMLPCDQFLRIA
jgi:PAS domain-containing protein